MSDPIWRPAELFDALFVSRELRAERDNEGEIWITPDELERFRSVRASRGDGPTG